MYVYLPSCNFTAACPESSKKIKAYLAEKELDLTATTDGEKAYGEADFVVISTPTNYDPETNYFNTSSVESVIEDALAAGTHACIVIKSTIPVGYTVGIRKKYGYKNIIFSPEFLREGKALYDNLYPARIVVGCDLADEELTARAKQFIELLAEGAIKKDIPERLSAAVPLGRHAVLRGVAAYEDARGSVICEAGEFRLEQIGLICHHVAGSKSEIGRPKHHIGRDDRRIRVIALLFVVESLVALAARRHDKRERRAERTLGRHGKFFHLRALRYADLYRLQVLRRRRNARRLQNRGDLLLFHFFFRIFAYRIARLQYFGKFHVSSSYFCISKTKSQNPSPRPML